MINQPIIYDHCLCIQNNIKFLNTYYLRVSEGMGMQTSISWASKIMLLAPAYVASSMLVINPFITRSNKENDEVL